MITYKSVPFVFDAVRFARDVRRRRVENNFTQDEIAALMGWSSGSTVSLIENAGGMTTLRNYVELCNLLDLDPRVYFSLSPA